MEISRGDLFRHDLEDLINRHSKENGSDTPDFILADFLIGCLGVFDATVRWRSEWYAARDVDPDPEGVGPT